jgi:hypothetical protein
MELPARSDVIRGVVLDAAVSTTIASMSLSLKKLVLAAALVATPLQSVAATLAVLLCHGAAQVHVVHASDASDRTMVGDTKHGNNGIGDSLANHPCCHNVVSAAPISAQPAAQPEFPVRAFAPDSLHDLFVPEQPHRPPLA